MLAADDRLVGVVVEIDQVLAPADPERLARGQHDPNGGLEAERPALGRTQGRRGPVMRADQRAELSAAGQKMDARPPVLGVVRLTLCQQGESSPLSRAVTLSVPFGSRSGTPAQ